MQFLLILLILVLPIQVFAGSDLYLKGSAGLFSLDDSDINFKDEMGDFVVGSADSGYGLSAAIGRSFSNGFDIELEFAFRTVEYDKTQITYPIDENISAYWGLTPDTTVNLMPSFGDTLDGSIDVKTLMVNGIYNLKTRSLFTPYFGVGMGVAWAEVEAFDDESFAYQFLAGIETEVSNNVSVLLGYRYLGIGNISGNVRAESYLTDTDVEEDLVWSDGEGSASWDSHSIELGLKYSF